MNGITERDITHERPLYREPVRNMGCVDARTNDSAGYTVYLAYTNAESHRMHQGYIDRFTSIEEARAAVIATH